MTVLIKKNDWYCLQSSHDESVSGHPQQQQRRVSSRRGGGRGSRSTRSSRASAAGNSSVMDDITDQHQIPAGATTPNSMGIIREEDVVDLSMMSPPPSKRLIHGQFIAHNSFSDQIIFNHQLICSNFCIRTEHQPQTIIIFFIYRGSPHVVGKDHSPYRARLHIYISRWWYEHSSALVHSEINGKEEGSSTIEEDGRISLICDSCRDTYTSARRSCHCHKKTPINK